MIFGADCRVRGTRQVTVAFWGLHSERQGLEVRASHGEVAALCPLLKQEEMEKSFVLSFSVPSAACLQLSRLSVCVCIFP